MKIIKLSSYKVIECECGTVFQPEWGDEFYFADLGFVGVFARIRCPLCRRLCIAEIEKEKATPPEKCVVCGDIIPEGRQVCPNCEKERKE